MHVIPLLHYNNVGSEMSANLCLENSTQAKNWLHRGTVNIFCIIWCNWYPKGHLMRIWFNLSNQNHFMSSHFPNIFHVTCYFLTIILLKLHWPRACRWQIIWLAYLNIIFREIIDITDIFSDITFIFFEPEWSVSKVIPIFLSNQHIVSLWASSLDYLL